MKETFIVGIFSNLKSKGNTTVATDQPINEYNSFLLLYVITKKREKITKAEVNHPFYCKSSCNKYYISKYIFFEIKIGLFFIETVFNSIYLGRYY